MRAELEVVMANVAVVALQALALLVARLVENARDRAKRRDGEHRYRSVKRTRRKRGNARRAETAKGCAQIRSRPSGEKSASNFPLEQRDAGLIV
ncbi:MAG: hypothetical protein DYG94_04640 [Leptolyngbya sp. PLA3]|nr:MAG: hypothetical protein EDM82_03790 [Cyanobacteria bacterium CYA]MCE7968019.1 hypothetical protein [Leptolyngbya sp. PL-A3]